MLDRFIDAAIRNRLLVLLAVLAVIAAMLVLIPKLDLDAFPDVTNIQVVVNTEAPGLAAEEVEQLITYPVEAVMYALPDVEEVRSTSSTGLSVVTVVFKDGTDLYFARQLVFERLQDAKERIPAGIGTPQMGPNTSGLGQVFQYVLRADDPGRYDSMALRGLNDWVVKQLLAPTPGVTQILSFGGEVRQYQVNLDPQRLLAQQLDARAVASAIEENNRNAGGWYVERGAEQLVLRGVGWVRSGDDGLRDIANIPLKSHDGGVVRVADVATVTYGAELRQGATTLGRRDAQGRAQSLGEVVTGIILKRMGANTKATIDGVKARLSIVQQALPAGVHIEPFYDQAQLVDQAVQTVSRALLEAAVLIIAILLLFLLNLRATLLVLLSIPLSVGMALAALSWWGISANLMSLGGLTIAIGMMVDGAVVMMENIHRRLGGAQLAEDAAPTTRIAAAAREVGRPIFFAVLIVIVVFAPLFTLQGVEGRMFRPMAISIMLAMIASLLVALVVTPALAAYLFRSVPLVHRELALFRWLENSYRRLLNSTLTHWRRALLAAAGLLLAALSLLPLLGTEFVPVLEEGTLGMRLTLAPSVSLKQSLEVSHQVETLLLQIPEITYALDRIGRPELGGDPEDVSNLEWYIGVKPL
ncbi:MAG: efflux RND transporter permease subunit, partial [Steroidobacteraceae bacterium]